MLVVGCSHLKRDVAVGACEKTQGLRAVSQESQPRSRARTHECEGLPTEGSLGQTWFEAIAMQERGMTAVSDRFIRMKRPLAANCHSCKNRGFGTMSHRGLTFHVLVHRVAFNIPLLPARDIHSGRGGDIHRRRV